MESFKKAIKFWAKDKPDNIVELDSRLETWNVPIVCTAIPEKSNNYRVKDIPVDATSDNATDFRLFQRLQMKVRGEVQKRIVNPIFRRETLSGNVWKNDVESKAAFMALAFNPTVLFRFPYVCMKYGGGLFVCVYILLLIFVMQPLSYMSMVFGRFSSDQLEKYPLLRVTSKGIPLVYLYMSLILLPHGNVILSYSALYVISGVLETSPDVCTGRMKRSSNCIPYNDINPINVNRIGLNNRTIAPDYPLSTELFFRYYIQGERMKQGSLFPWPVGREWRFLAGLSGILFILAFVGTRHIVSKFSRLLIYSSFLLPLSLIGLLGFQLLWRGALQGIFQYFFDLQWRLLGTLGFWTEAWSMAFSTCLPGYGILNWFAKYKTSIKGLYTLSWLFCLSVMTVTVLSFALVASEAGFLEKVSHITNYFHTVTDEVAFGFICMSNSLAKLPTKWPLILFFGYVTVIGLWTQMVITDACVSYINTFIKYTCPGRLAAINGARIYFTTIVLFASILLIILYGSRDGPQVMETDYLYNAAWAACVICMVQVYSATRHYGIRLFFIKLEVLNKKPPSKFFITEMRYLILPCLSAGFLPMLLNLFSFGTLKFVTPDGSQPGIMLRAYGFVLNILPVLMLAIYILRIKKFRRKKKVTPLSAGASSQRFGVIQPPSSSRRLQISETLSVAGMDVRFFERRKSITVAGDHGLGLALLSLEDESKAVKNHTIQMLQRKELEKLLWRKLHAVSAGETSVETVSPEMLQKYPLAESYFRRYRPLDIHHKDIQYLSKLLKNYDVNSAFVSATAIVTREKERPHVLIQNLLMLHNGDIQDTLYIEPNPHLEIISRIYGRPLPDVAMRIIYADHILQELGAPYARHSEKLWGDMMLRNEDLLAMDPQWIIEPIYAEYVITYPLKDSQTYGRYNILVIESINHSLLERLPLLRPQAYRVRKEVLSSLTPEEQMNLVCSKIPTKLYFPAISSSQTHQVKFSRSDEYTKQIHSQPFSRVYDFLHPSKVCIVVLITPDDEEMFDVLDKYFVHPAGKAGYLRKPRRWRDRAERRLELIENYFQNKSNNNHNAGVHPGDIQLITFGQIYALNQLRQLKETLLATKSDIIFHDENVNKSADLQSSSSIAALGSFDDDTALRIALQRRRFHITAETDDSDFIEHNQGYDKFHDFLENLATWRAAPKRISSGKISRLKGNRKPIPNKGRRKVSRTNLDMNLQSLKLRLFPMGSDPMRSIIEGPGPVTLYMSGPSGHSIRTGASGSLHSESLRTSGGTDESSGSSNSWPTRRYGGSLNVQDPRKKDINDDHRYAYVAFRKARTKGKVLEVHRRKDSSEASSPRTSDPGQNM